MTIYRPSHFAMDDSAAMARLMREYPFATLVTPATPEPYVSHLPLLHVDAKAQLAASALLTGLTGVVAPGALPMLGGDLDYFGPGSLAVQGLWPVLWGRYLRDVTGAGDFEIPLARWAIRNLAVEGPRPAFRVGKQPYGLLPTSSFNAWVDAPGDPLSAEVRCRTATELGRDGWVTRAEIDAVMSCDAESFRVRTELEAFENGERVRRREWSFETPRELG